MSLRSIALLFFFVSGVSAFASIEQAPPNFPHRLSEAVYVDFITADYHLTYDLTTAAVSVESEIVFDMPKTGYPIFDLVPVPTGLTLDGVTVEQEQRVDPDGVSNFRVLQKEVRRGRHTLRMRHSLTKNVSFKQGGVASAFWTSDLDDRRYLEQYLPSSFEYDQVEMHLTVDVVGADNNPHSLRANGVVTSVGTNRFTVDFPEFYTTSSVFFHLTPTSAFPSKKFNFWSVDGRLLPVEIYSTYELAPFEAAANAALKELERDYGPFPHPKLVIYGTSSGSGGMEYSGATISSTWALGHELFHSYNARSVMPANGNAGWMDEAISSWRDHRYELRKVPGFSSTKMAGHSKWTRKTDDAAYDEGSYFLAWIADRMQERGQDLKIFLRNYFARHRGTTVTTEMFRDELIALTSLDLARDFDVYIYGKGQATTNGRVIQAGTTWPNRGDNLACDLPAASTAGSRETNPYHPHLTDEQLQDLLWP